MASPNLSFIVAAAGKGSRYGDGLPKQFRRINNIPIYIYSLLSIKKVKGSKEVFLTLNKSMDEKIVKKQLDKYGLDKVRIIRGSETRGESVFNAFSKIEKKRGFIVIHDSVRPNFNFNVLNKLINQMKGFSGLIVASKIQDTIKSAQNISIDKTVDRDGLWLAETPQIFRYNILKKCYSGKISYKSCTDESQLLEKNNFRVKVYENLEYNNKITTRKDLEIYKKLIRDV